MRLIIYLNIFKPHCLFSILLGFWWHKDLNFCYSTHRPLRFCSFFFQSIFTLLYQLVFSTVLNKLFYVLYSDSFLCLFFYAIKPINFKILVILSFNSEISIWFFFISSNFFPLSVVFLLHCWDFLFFFFNCFKLVETFLWCLL